MKKKVVFSMLLINYLFGNEVIDIEKGWNNIGFSEEYNIKKLAEDKNFKYVWYFEPTKQEWEFYSPNDDLRNMAISNNIEILPDVLPKYSGVWVYSDLEESIDIKDSVDLFNAYATSYYNNTQYAIGIENGKLFLATSLNNNEWSNFILLDENFTNVSNVLLYANSENNVIFTYTISNDENKSVYVGNFDGEKVSKVLVTTLDKYDYISTYYNKIFTDSENNDTQYIIFYNYSKHNVLIAINNSENEWKFEEFDNSRVYNVNYYYQYRDNAPSLYKLNKFNLFTLNPLKTIFYSVNNGIHKNIELDYIWSSISYFNDYDNNKYGLYLKTYRAYGIQGKHLALIKNDSDLVNVSDFNHSVVGVGIIGIDEMYAFAHDEIGDSLYIYKSTDMGRSWNLYKEIKNFDYQINYISSIYKDSNGEIYCRMRVNDYSFDIESKDSFENWQEVITNYKSNSQSIENSDYVLRKEKNNSITIINKQQ